MIKPTRRLTLREELDLIRSGEMAGQDLTEMFSGFKTIEPLTENETKELWENRTWPLRFRKHCLAWQDLSDVNLSNCNLSGLNLRGVNLNRANLSGANLTDTNLSDARLCNVNFSYADIYWTNLESADLSGALVDFAIFVGPFIDCKLTGLNFNYADISKALFKHCHFSNAGFGLHQNAIIECCDNCNNDELDCTRWNSYYKKSIGE